MRARLLRPIALAALAMALIGCGVAVRGVDRAVRSAADSRLFHRGRAGALTARERVWALAAWKYFEVNTQPSSGMVNAVDKNASLTMWQAADYIAALTAAYELKLITQSQFDERFRRVLHFLNVVELYDGRVPNRTYNPETWRMTTAANQPGMQGWSAIDLGRLLVWLRIARDRYPKYGEYIDKVVLRWNFCDVVDDGALQGGLRVDGRTRIYQEGRLGYEEYAAAGFRLWGFATDRASSLEPSAQVRLYDVDVLVDARDPRTTGQAAPQVMLPSLLLGLELNWRDDASTTSGLTPLEQQAEALYRVQERRYLRQLIYTARTDHPISRAPFFVFDSIISGGYPFNTVADDGSYRPEAALVSTRASFGMWALWNTSYTSRLMDIIAPLHRAERGWFEGRFEQTGGDEPTMSATTNAMVLESLLYKADGTLFKSRPRVGHFDVVTGDEFARPAHCLPVAGPGVGVAR